MLAGMSAVREELHHRVDELPEAEVRPVLELIRHDEDRLADEVVGRIGPLGPLTLVVDGHAVSWDESGEALSPYEGWQFVLRITDRFGDPRL